MKAPKSLIGREVRITWMDPVGSNREDLEHAKKGRAALALWVERGLVDDITEGVVRILQSVVTEAGEEKPNEAIIGWIPEELITKIEVGEFKELE